MPRLLTFNIPAEGTDKLLAALRESGAAISLSVQRGASTGPRSDVVRMEATTDGVRRTMDLLRTRGMHEELAYSTSELDSVIAPEYEERLSRETSESTWSEMAFFIRHESNLTLNYLAFMGLSGGVAAVGLWKNAPHIVVGAMLIAPAMLPLLRISFGLVGSDRTLAMRGINSTLAGYAAVIIGALVTTAVLRVVDPISLEQFRSYAWVGFWSTLSPAAVVVAIVAAAAGCFAVSARRVVPLAGVLIALDLVPATGMTGMALVLGDPGFAAQNLGRASVDAGLVLVVGAVVLGLKRWRMHRSDGEPR
jgi:uncharacterized hydrophobic protein (TIGR00271 family)